MLHRLILVAMFSSPALAQTNSETLTLNCKFLEGVSRSGNDMMKNDPERDIIIEIDLAKQTCVYMPCTISDNEFAWTQDINSGSKTFHHINRHTGFYKRFTSGTPAWLNYQCSPSRPKF